ncbi:hypothetical protein EX30DRAFT_156978 [Ascodesmis nigricans]|uniref:Secreted protein n=1 Tax=Ascodesmis nigricans TaxID=341454 RepID=A0A4S2MN80_9PEZI|nr:hypothetical protein EX30DRAFT_156978 [Ascodesmis nigricans]
MLQYHTHLAVLMIIIVIITQQPTWPSSTHPKNTIIVRVLHVTSIHNPPPPAAQSVLPVSLARNPRHGCYQSHHPHHIAIITIIMMTPTSAPTLTTTVTVFPQPHAPPPP